MAYFNHNTTYTGIQRKQNLTNKNGWLVEYFMSQDPGRTEISMTCTKEGKRLIKDVKSQFTKSKSQMM